MLHLWIIDDNITLLNTLELALHGDFRIVTFSSPLACLFAFREGKMMKPDVVLTDFDMPGINGLDMLGRILPDSPHIKAYLISSALNDEIISQAVQMGVKGWMGKPFDLIRLRKMLMG